MPFDRDYYRRFYFNPQTAVTSRAEMRARARLIVGCVNYVGLPVGSILDAGCGVGLLRAPLLRAFRRADYTGVEVSQYLCQRYGWHCSPVEKFRSRRRFDLVVCYDVLQYLAEDGARCAIDNLARLCRGALYFGALTTEDWRENCDQSRTHRVAGLRLGSWYRRELSRSFRPLGCGMWLKKELPLTVWNLDAVA
ncbi:MAG TPA: class I SAM-dependent methyltransferase [Steroidobacteraceae bacterium]|jgi:SAM-dependent methyltransferase|nr:class I SAM-dependent methyltransferase [Steroidobacteraceae bacterium]